jgi:hypothetical protein
VAIATLNDLLAALPSAKRTQMFKGTATTNGAGYYHSTWTLSGEPAAGSAAGSLNGAVCANTTTGAMLLNTPSAGNTLYMAGAQGVAGSERVVLSIFDRVWHNSAIDANINTNQAITSPAWTRWTDGLGLELWVECYTAWGAGAFTLTITYTDENSASSSAVHSQAADAPVAGQAYRVPLASGDQGILSVSNAVLSAGSGSSGNLGLTVCKRICDIAIPASGTVDLDWSQTGLTEIPSGACLFGIMAVQDASVTGSALTFTIAEG